MDRFIALIVTEIVSTEPYLKSNMDRFIAYRNIYFQHTQGI